MRTPKIEALGRLINRNFMHQKHPNIHVESPLDTSPIDSNAWLSGMWDADGSFKLTISYGSFKFTISYAKGLRIKYSVRIQADINLRQFYHYDVAKEFRNFFLQKNFFYKKKILKKFLWFF